MHSAFNQLDFVNSHVIFTGCFIEMFFYGMIVIIDKHITSVEYVIDTASKTAIHS